jgi:hypothetical protein
LALVQFLALMRFVFDTADVAKLVERFRAHDWHRSEPTGPPPKRPRFAWPIRALLRAGRDYVVRCAACHERVSVGRARFLVPRRSRDICVPFCSRHSRSKQS